MDLLISSKIPLSEALDLSRRMSSFHPISKSLSNIREDILKGSSLYESMAKFKIYNPRFVRLIKVGEETSQLALIFEKLSKQLEADLRHQAKIIGNVLEPLIVIFLGLFVAIILIAMFKLSSAF